MSQQKPSEWILKRKDELWKHFHPDCGCEEKKEKEEIIWGCHVCDSLEGGIMSFLEKSILDYLDQLTPCSCQKK